MGCVIQGWVGVSYRGGVWYVGMGWGGSCRGGVGWGGGGSYRDGIGWGHAGVR